MKPILWIEVTILLLFVFAGVNAQRHIDIKTPMAPPEWALLERALLDENERFVHHFADKYVNPITGHLECLVRWGGADGPDDAMENFNKWSLLYALGAPESTLELFNFIWNGHLDQYTKAKHPLTGEGMLYREFITSFDWEHTGEGMAAFLLLPLSDPEDRRTQERIVRFADFYTGRDSTTHNYDPEKKIIRSAFNGSRGPMFDVTNEDWFGNNVEAVQSRQEIMKEFRNVKGDIPFNLCATSLAANAYLLTGDEHYKDWVLEYAGAWRQRTIDNNGVIPSNVGINGIIGEHWDGNWYGGLFGWNFGDLGGFNMIRRGMRIGFNNAYLLSGDPDFLEILRKQGDILLANRKRTEKGLMPPNKYGKDGWYDYRRNDVTGHFTDLYIMTLEDHDMDRLYDAAQGRVNPWIEFLQGKQPDHPVKALNQELAGLRMRSANIRDDRSTPDTRDSDDTQRFSSAGTSAFINLAMGGLQPMSPGGLLFCQLRYFDRATCRPGLPGDVAALVTGMTKDMTMVTLVNINQVEPRDLIIQTGAYGEHYCERVETGGKSYPVDDRFFNVRLDPGTGAELVIYVKRFANKPTLAFPWHGDKVPLL